MKTTTHHCLVCGEALAPRNCVTLAGPNIHLVLGPQGPPTPEQGSAVVRYWAEVLHEYGGGQWGPRIDDGRRWESFRELFQAVQWHVREFVTREE